MPVLLTESSLLGVWRPIEGDGIHGLDPHQHLVFATDPVGLCLEYWSPSDSHPTSPLRLRETIYFTHAMPASGRLTLDWTDDHGPRQLVIVATPPNRITLLYRNTSAGMVTYQRMKRPNRRLPNI